MFLASYGSGTMSVGEVKVLRDVESELQGRDVVIVDDILDSGRTLAFAKTMLVARGSRSVRTCVLLDKEVPRAANIVPDFTGFRCKPVFVVGYGMDLAHRYRELPFIGEVSTAITTLMLVFAVIGAVIPPVVIVQALRSKAMDRWPEGVLVGVYLGTLGIDQRHSADRLFQLSWLRTA